MSVGPKIGGSGTLLDDVQTLNLVYSPSMLNLRRQAVETMEDVSVASKKVGQASDLVGIGLLAVAGVSLVALLIAVVALERAKHDR